MTIDLQADGSCSQTSSSANFFSGPVIGSPTPKETWLWHVAIWTGGGLHRPIRTACPCPRATTRSVAAS